jgi:hypothetical protein
MSLQLFPQADYILSWFYWDHLKDLEVDGLIMLRRSNLEVNSQIPRCSHAAPMPRPCRAHAAPMPFPCHAVPLRVWIVPFPFDLHSAAMFDSHMPCRAPDAPVPCHDHAFLKATSQGHDTAWNGHGFRLLQATTRSSTKVVIRSIATR